MKEDGCRFCNPDKFDWEENGFYGYSCPGCSNNKSAFIIRKDHGDITPDEKIIIGKLIEDHYPHLKSSGQAERRKVHYHWYDFLNQKEKS